MSVPSNEVSVPNQNRALELPGWATKYQYDMTEINRAVRPPFIKCIHSQTREPYKPPFIENDVIVAPNMIKIGDKENPFVFVPILYFPTFCVVNPFKMKGQLPFIREVSYDPESAIARKCRTMCKTDPCLEAPKEFLKYSQTHNFFLILEDVPELSDTPVWYPCSGGEFKTGQKLVGLIQSRQPYPPFLCRFRGFAEEHKNSQFKWGGLGFLNDNNPYTSEERADRYQQLHTTLSTAVKDRQFDLTGGGDSEESGDASSETKF